MNDVLGKGAFGTVYKGYKREKKRLVACKQIDIHHISKS